MKETIDTRDERRRRSLWNSEGRAAPEMCVARTQAASWVGSFTGATVAPAAPAAAAGPEAPAAGARGTSAATASAAAPGSGSGSPALAHSAARISKPTWREK